MWGGVKKGGKKLNIKGKKINAFGKSIPVIAVVLMVLTTGIAGAALVSVYFDTTVAVTVGPALGVVSTTYETTNMKQGETITQVIDIKNVANVPILTEVGTLINPAAEVTVTYEVGGIVLSDIDADGEPELIIPPDCTITMTARIHADQALVEGTYTITTSVNPPKGVELLILENKDASWNIIDTDNRIATLIYTPEEPTFNYNLFGVGLDSKTDYSLIYYADKPDRFVNWGGNNPGKLITTGTTDKNGVLVMHGEKDLYMDLPSGDDANIDEYDYRNAPDFYHNAHGAKIWLVPTDALPSAGYPGDGDWAFWNVGGILFETDLISYTRK